MNAPAAPLKIGQVHALLRREHPNLELSKIRYYEEMGLVAPARSRKGYRLYSEKDVNCLREAIRLADKEFVPLRVIRVRLIEQGLLRDDLGASPAQRHAARSTQAKVVSLPVPATTPATVTHLSAVPGGTQDAESPSEGFEDQLSANQLLEMSHVEPDLLNRVLSLGLVTPSSRGTESTFSRLDVGIVQASAALLRAGADPRLLGALRRVVEREVGIIDDLTADLRGGTSTAAEVTAVRLAVTHDVETLRAEVFQRALSDFLNL